MSDFTNNMIDPLGWHPPPSTFEELRWELEDAWLDKQRELARIPSCPCDHPPGWHFSGLEVIGIVLFLAVLILIGAIS